MFEDDDGPRPKIAEVPLGRPLDGISVVDMQERITALRAEIARLEAEIARREGHRAAADALFKRPPERR